MSNDVSRLQRRFERERNARLQAEQILEEKSRELFDKNQALERLSEDLERLVEERTQELEIARDEAVDAAHAKSEFLANMSHELRTPMNGVLGMLRILADTGLNDIQKKHLYTATRSGELLLSVINDILDFSKIDAGKMHVERVAFSPFSLLDDIISVLEFGAHEKNIELKKHCSSTIPQALYGDPTRIKQVITNLVSNAIKFTDRGHVSIDMHRIKSNYIIQVQDSGIGMSAEQLAHIFEAFNQGDSSITRTHGGTGLGLTITNLLVQMMGGEVNVASVLGQGSTFTVTLPIHEASIDEVIKQNDSNDDLVFNGEPILVAEDNEVNQKIILYLLEEANLNATLVENGKDAVQAVKEKNYPVVLMDLQMPIMDGLEATRQIRSFSSDVPIIAMTAHASQEHIDECIQVGMNAHTAKPIDSIILTNTIARWIKPAGHRIRSDAKEVQPKQLLIHGLDYAEALSRVRGKIPILNKVLKSFCTQNHHFIATLKEALENNEKDKVIHELHSLKGSSANISAKNLSQFCSELEAKAKQGDLESARNQLPQLEGILTQLLTNIAATFSEESSDNQKLEAIDDDKWNHHLQLIGQHIQSDFAEAEKYIQALNDFKLSESQKALASDLLEAADNFDSDTIKILVSQT